MIQLFDPNTGLARAHQGHQWKGWKAARGGRVGAGEVTVESFDPGRHSIFGAAKAEELIYNVILYLYIMLKASSAPQSDLLSIRIYFQKSYLFVLSRVLLLFRPPYSGNARKKMFFLKDVFPQCLFFSRDAWPET